MPFLSNFFQVLIFEKAGAPDFCKDYRQNFMENFAGLGPEKYPS
jgi:hypothetical protein